ncbi:uncharacterized protein LOC121267576 [Juglans microcarpa x Juglans regia]|uniref:uncharacterized protein LOC121267576 n=1 Tax=Juglans microcarpa x Juglans regia TaxID=2249226 RepID=UPI001B7E9FFA|nr:uncharacterized protein LOC121267576 [Juglans microcarpa x Juglans regia]XP_041027430.1 uncharacterized protein LOC121267576 [Juglans microcarpa x Juglans regia]
MGLLLWSLSMPILLVWFFCPPSLWAQSTYGSSRSAARALDVLLQDYAYRAFVHPKTGIPYDGIVPSNFTGIKITAVRFRRGSLYRRGFKMYKEFHIPIGVIEQPYVKRLVLVYQNLGNWSMVYYPLPGYTYLTPVLGLLAYSASNLSATGLLELNVTATGDPILIRFPDVKSPPHGAVTKCVWFDLHGYHNFSNVASGNTCSTIQQGHFSIVVESIAPSPQPIKVGIIVGSVLGGLALLVLLTFLVLWVQKFKHRKKMQQMERAADVGEAVHMTMVGNVTAPVAMVTRTQPVLESEYAP